MVRRGITGNVTGWLLKPGPIQLNKSACSLQEFGRTCKQFLVQSRRICLVQLNPNWILKYFQLLERVKSYFDLFIDTFGSIRSRCSLAVKDNLIVCIFVKYTMKMKYNMCSISVTLHFNQKWLKNEKRVASQWSEETNKTKPRSHVCVHVFVFLQLMISVLLRFFVEVRIVERQNAEVQIVDLRMYADSLSNLTYSAITYVALAWGGAVRWGQTNSTFSNLCLFFILDFDIKS
jgi:hypothetical protein